MYGEKHLPSMMTLGYNSPPLRRWVQNGNEIKQLDS